MSTAFPEDRDDRDDLGDFTVPDDLSSLLGDAGDSRGEGEVIAEVSAPDDLSSLDDGAPAAAAAAAPAAEEPSTEPGAAVPDDLSELTAPRKRELAVLLTQVADAEALAAACALAELDVDAVPTPVGALAVLRDPSGEGPENAATAISRLVAGVPLVLVTRTEGQLTAVRYQDGQAEGNLPPGLVLSGAPEALEDLLTGQIAVGDLPGGIGTQSIGRLKAMRMLASIARKARKKQ